MTYETIRIYNRKNLRTDINAAEHSYTDGYLEYSYTEYRVIDGVASLKGKGTEDFSINRYNSEMHCKGIYTWDGERRNKGGHRWFDYRGFVDYIGSTKALKAVMMQKYGCEEVSLR